MKYLIIIEKTSSGYSAYSPDIPGCVSTGKTVNITKINIQEAIEFHIDGLKHEGYEVPMANSTSAEIEIAA